MKDQNGPNRTHNVAEEVNVQSGWASRLRHQPCRPWHDHIQWEPTLHKVGPRIITINYTVSLIAISYGEIEFT